MPLEQSSLLVVDDELSVRDSLYNWFRKDGLKVHAAANASEAQTVLQSTPIDVVLLDIKMPGMDGMELLERIKAQSADVTVIMMTAFASVETAVRALKQGAFDYVTKPIDPDELSHLVRRALDQRRLKAENSKLRETIDDQLSGVDAIVGESPQVKHVIDLIHHVSSTDATVLIGGESGTGKELIARAIHAQSNRRYFPLIPVNCGALSETLLESELFGHEKGAFTGAQFRRKGRIEMADGGTLFLDEIGTIGLRMQIDLLRVLESKEVHRVGGNNPIKVDFRLVCATNQDLQQLIRQGLFREDLFYRINVFTIVAPPLRERRGDVPMLAMHFLRQLSNQMDKRITEISPEAMRQLSRYNWPGNVRELRNAIERALVVGRPPAIRPEDLPFLEEPEADAPRGDSLEDVERSHISNILLRANWNITHAAEILRIDRATLYNKIRKYGLKRSDQANDDLQG